MTELPTAKVIQVDTTGAVILVEESPDTRDSRGIYLPNHVEPISHIAIDIGGSLAKVVYFTRSTQPPHSSKLNGEVHEDAAVSPHFEGSSYSPPRSPPFGGALTPAILDGGPRKTNLDDLSSLLRRRASLQHFPGGSLNFHRFETDNVHDCVNFVRNLIETSARINRVSLEEMKRGVQIIATGGGAHKFNDILQNCLKMKVMAEDEMDCLITGLKFITHIPNEVYYFSDELIHAVAHPNDSKQTISMLTQIATNGSLDPSASSSSGSSPAAESSSSPVTNSFLASQEHQQQQQQPLLERPSPNPPKYSVSFEESLTPQLPCLLVNIGSGVSIIKIDEDGQFERVSGTSLGGGTLWGLLSLLTGATSFDEMLEMSEKGDNSCVDMLVGDIYGQDYSKLGLKNTMIASSFGKVFRKGGIERRKFSNEDISKSLLYAISNNIGQIAYMNAEKYNLSRIYFSGFFIRGHASTIATLSYAIRFWSKGSKRALFLRHEGFLGAIGAWIKNIEYEGSEANSV